MGIFLFELNICLFFFFFLRFSCGTAVRDGSWRAGLKWTPDRAGMETRWSSCLSSQTLSTSRYWGKPAESHFTYNLIFNRQVKILLKFIWEKINLNRHLTRAQAAESRFSKHLMLRELLCGLSGDGAEGSGHPHVGGQRDLWDQGAVHCHASGGGCGRQWPGDH